MRNEQQLSIAPELRLLVQCCRWNFIGNGEAGPGCDLAGLDWNAVVKLARRHRVQGLVWLALVPHRREVPDKAADALAAEAANIAQQGLRTLQALIALRDRFASAGIAMMFVKGLTVAKLAYRNPFVKLSSDLDILVAPDALAAASAHLGELGYRLIAPKPNGAERQLARWHRWHKDSLWQSPDGLLLDLHVRLADNSALIPGVGLESPRQLVEIAPGAVLPTLAGDQLFAYLCVHGASSAWFRLKWISDFAGLLSTYPPAQIERLYRSARALGAERAATQALLLADHLFGSLAGTSLRIELEQDRVGRGLAAAALGQLVNRSEPTAARLGTWTIHLTQFRLGTGLRFKLAELAGQLGRALQ